MATKQAPGPGPAADSEPLLCALRRQGFFDGLGTEPSFSVRTGARRSMELQLLPEISALLLRIPCSSSQEEALHFLLSRRAWLERQWRKLQPDAVQNEQLMRSVGSESAIFLQRGTRAALGQLMPFLGQGYLLQRHAGRGASGLEIGSRTLSFPCPPGCLGNPAGTALSDCERKYLERALRAAALPLLKQRCRLWERQVQGVLHKDLRQIKVRKYKARWGSCSTDGELTFNWHLIFAPLRVIDYVVLHELCHLGEFNHSRRFWELVERAMPAYREPRQWLRHFGHYLLRF